MGPGAIFTFPSVPVISAARIGRWLEWEGRALVIVPGVGAEGQAGGWPCKFTFVSPAWAGLCLGRSVTLQALVPWV